MTVQFEFDAEKSFEENFTSFLDAMESLDADMASTLRANVDKLANVVRLGERDPSARGVFNAAIAAALDAPEAADPEPEGA